MSRLTLALCAIAACGGAAAEQPTPQQVLSKAKSAAVSISGQAEALVRLAWPDEGPYRPEVQAEARQELVFFASYSIQALRDAQLQVKPIYQGDVAATLVEARRRVDEGQPEALLPALEEAIWYGSIDARRVAMNDISRFRFPPAVLSIIDALYLDPELAVTGIRALGRMADKRSRYYLTSVLNHSTQPTLQREAARALTRHGEPGVAALRKGVESPTLGVRSAALEPWLPLAGVADLSLLHEYVGSRSRDDPRLIELVRQRAIELELQYEQEQMTDSASGDGADGS